MSSRIICVLLFVLQLISADDRTYDRCELARELRDLHYIPIEQIGDWVCIAQHASNLMTSTHRGPAHGLFGIFESIWCSTGGQNETNVCQIDCAKLLDDDIWDDVRCAKKIHASAAYGFTPWDFHASKCRDQTTTSVDECFKDIVPTENRFGRCELARELRYKQNVPLRQIGDWVCIAEAVANYTTSVRIKQSEDGYSYGLFQIYDSVWCSVDGRNGRNECGIACDKLLDADITDDVKCAMQIHRSGGFNEWHIYYENHCLSRAPLLVADCFPGDNKELIKQYDRCELASEMRNNYGLPFDQISALICIAKHATNFTLSTRTEHTYGLWGISDYSWCNGGESHHPNECHLHCEKLFDDDLSDDIACAMKINTIEGYGRAWAYLNFNGLCGHRATESIKDCFKKRTTVMQYERCGLAKELQKKHGIPSDRIGQWICLAQIASNMTPSAHDNEHAYGLFQLHDSLWCSTGANVNAPNICQINCNKLLDSDISDDVACARKIEKVQGFASGWSHLDYATQCGSNEQTDVSDCFSDDVKTYDACELARELYGEHNVPREQLGDWVCLAKYASNFTTSFRNEQRFGLFQIPGEPWCATDGHVERTVCQLSCEKMLDEDIGDDIACARQMHATRGFTAWSEFNERNCRNKAFELVRDCFNIQSLVHF